MCCVTFDDMFFEMIKQFNGHCETVNFMPKEGKINLKCNINTKCLKV